jgi:hypothetical protein
MIEDLSRVGLVQQTRNVALSRVVRLPQLRENLQKHIDQRISAVELLMCSYW